jgi:hypothetical protein
MTILQEIRKLLADPAHWHQGCYAINAHGNFESPTSEHACQWCLMGAVLKTINWPYPSMYEKIGLTPEVEAKELLYKDIRIKLKNAISLYTNRVIPDVVQWNDKSTTTHNDVMAALTIAIETENNHIGK